MSTTRYEEHTMQWTDFDEIGLDGPVRGYDPIADGEIDPRTDEDMRNLDEPLFHERIPHTSERM